MQFTTYEKVLAFLLRVTANSCQKGGELHLRNITALCEESAHPQRSFQSIHIAGTNGKGSVSHMVASILDEAGYKVGLFTSPHLTDFRERIQVNGELIPKSKALDLFNQLFHNDTLDRVQPSFFEVTVWMAYMHFMRSNVDWAVIETGMGGRLDATNTLRPAMSIITNIGYDHQEILGNTLKDIAREKAGIIKEKVPVLIGDKHAKTASIFEGVAKKKKLLYIIHLLYYLART